MDLAWRASCATQPLVGDDVGYDVAVTAAGSSCQAV
jgi:hypothetical protein